MKKYWRFLSIIAILVIVLTAAIGVASTASAQTVCSPATVISVPFTKDGLGTFCWQTTTLCDHINSWNIGPELSINGTSYANVFALGSSIPPLNGVYTITYKSTVTQFAHFEIDGPCSGGGPTATLTRTPTLGGPTPTRTRTATNGPSPTRTRTPTAVSTACDTPYSCGTGTPVTPPVTPVPTITWTPTIVGAPTPVVGPNGVCSPVSGDIAPDPGGQTLEIAVHGTFCWRSTNLGSAINSFSTLQVLINGGNFTNIWAPTSSLPAKINGFWYVYFQSSVFDGHFMIFP